jgi:demethylspheroidene O-methyltransferase
MGGLRVLLPLERRPDVAAWPGRWLDALLAFRDRLLASPRFQRWATIFPPTRLVARRRARALFDLCAGFVYSQILLACVELRLFDILAEGPQSVAVLARRLALPTEAAERLLRAAAALALVTPRRGGRFGLGPLGAGMLGNPAVAAMVEHHRLLYADLADPVARLREGGSPGQLARYWSYGNADHPGELEAERVAGYSGLMAVSQELVAAEVLDAYPFGRHQHLLDIGGGNGAFLAAVAARTPGLKLTLFDLPAVAALARQRLAASGLGGRINVVGGDFFSNELPRGADLASLIRVVHDHDDHKALALLRSVRRALGAHGTLVLAEPTAATPGAEPIGDAYFGFYLLAMGSGRPRRPEELVALLRAAGFSKVRTLKTRLPIFTRMLVVRSSE